MRIEEVRVEPPWPSASEDQGALSRLQWRRSSPRIYRAASRWVRLQPSRIPARKEPTREKTDPLPRTEGAVGCFRSKTSIRDGTKRAIFDPRIDDLAGGGAGERPVKDPAAKKEKWGQFRLQASNGFVGLPNRLVDSKAFASLTTGASVQTLVWFWQMVEYEKKRKGGESPIGRIDKMTNHGELSFTYQEAQWRGIKQGRFSRALKELFRLGFIDISRHGRGVKGEYTKYALSNRWQKYGTPEWKESPYPENFHEGFRSDEYKEKRKQSKNNSVQKWTLPTSENGRYEGDESPHNIRKGTLKIAPGANSQRPKRDVSIDLAMPTETSEKAQKKVRTLNSRSKSNSTPIRRDENTFWAEDEPLVHSFGNEVAH